ncbi:IMP-specific 5'-nucleotidase 1 [Physcia stellaris]|nr:IMP-specific 5'-nucleotidase 1 [Physcia stellaris]
MGSLTRHIAVISWSAAGCGNLSKDTFANLITGLLAVPFVLHSQPTAAWDEDVVPSCAVAKMAKTAHQRYVEIMRDVEGLINDHIAHQKRGAASRSKLKLLVPTVGTFFTPLLLADAFAYQDQRRHISSRRFVPPSFNDIRLTLNSAQIMSLVRQGPLHLVTFDGDVTLYDDGLSLTPENPVIPRILGLLERGIKVGIVTAAGYTEAEKYYSRLYGLLDAINDAVDKRRLSDPSLVVMGGESNYLFVFDASASYRLKYIPRHEWLLDAMRAWSDEDISSVLDVAESALKECVGNLGLTAQILRKERAVGIVPVTDPGGRRFTREQLEEMVLVTQQVVEMSAAGKRVPFCGNDIFVDIGDKSWGVLACQRYLGGIEGSRTLHVGDQFLSAGANDFKARLACTTAWIASPAETVQLLDELVEHDHQEVNGV